MIEIVANDVEVLDKPLQLLEFTAYEYPDMDRSHLIVCPERREMGQYLSLQYLEQNVHGVDPRLSVGDTQRQCWKCLDILWLFSRPGISYFL